MHKQKILTFNSHKKKSFEKSQDSNLGKQWTQINQANISKLRTTLNHQILESKRHFFPFMNIKLDKKVKKKKTLKFIITKYNILYLIN